MVSNAVLANGDQLLLVGPMRFVNSDCDPNCEYDFSSSDGVVQLKVKRTAYPGSEVLVKYGDEFFEKNTCRCQTCERIISEAEHYFSSVLRSSIFVTVEEILYEIKDAHSTVLKQGIISSKKMGTAKAFTMKLLSPIVT